VTKFKRGDIVLFKKECTSGEFGSPRAYEGYGVVENDKVSGGLIRVSFFPGYNWNNSAFCFPEVECLTKVGEVER